MTYNKNMESANKFEVEVKALLENQQIKDEFVTRLRRSDRDLKITKQSGQLNHYFDRNGDPKRLLSAVKPLLSASNFKGLWDIIRSSSRFALRTRKDTNVRLIVKAAQAGEDEQHAITRLEGDYLATTESIDTLDQLILNSGYNFLSKWSRHRTEYLYKDYTICLDRNAGYGYMVEIEKVVDTQEAIIQARDAIFKELADLDLSELSQERIGRMFDFYNQHWRDYYGTKKTFVVM